ncbi:MAG: transposase [Candidatus Ozemobacteraceae bacterium]
MGRSDTQENAEYFLKGLLSDLPGKAAEPIAEFWDLDRKSMQRFVGAGPWKDAPIEDAMVRDISETLGDPGGVLSVDPSFFPKQGKFSVGVANDTLFQYHRAVQP